MGMCLLYHLPVEDTYIDHMTQGGSHDIASGCDITPCITSFTKTCVKRPLKIDKAKILMTNGSLMKVQSIAECSPWSILQYF